MGMLRNLLTILNNLYERQRLSGTAGKHQQQSMQDKV